MNRTKDAIVAAFGELLTERPLSKITVKDIVDRCEISRNTFYYHFEDSFHPDSDIWKFHLY